MSKAKLGTTCAAVVLSCVFVTAQTTSSTTPQVAAAQNNRGRAPDKPLPNNDAAKSAQTATISGCVVREAANGGQPTITANGIAYGLTGRSDKELQRYLGKRIEVTGMLDSGSRGTRATSGKIETTNNETDKTTGAPKDQTATAGQSDVTATGTPRDNTAPGVQQAPAVPDAVPLATDKGTTADLTSRIQVKTIRMIAPNCL